MTLHIIGLHITWQLGQHNDIRSVQYQLWVTLSFECVKDCHQQDQKGGEEDALKMANVPPRVFLRCAKDAEGELVHVYSPFVFDLKLTILYRFARHIENRYIFGTRTEHTVRCMSFFHLHGETMVRTVSRRKSGRLQRWPWESGPQYSKNLLESGNTFESLGSWESLDFTWSWGSHWCTVFIWSGRLFLLMAWSMDRPGPHWQGWWMIVNLRMIHP